MHIRALAGDIDASGSFWGSLKGLKFIGAFGSEFAPICDWLWEQRDFLVFHDFDDVVVFSRAGYG